MRLRDDDLVVREIDGETVLLDLVTSTYLSTNRTGTYLLQLLASDQDREMLATALEHRFDISAEAALADTDAFLAMLNAQNLLI